MKSSKSEFALSGATPAFADLVPFGQYHLPDENDYRQVLARIDRNGYYTNHGPLAKELECALAEYLNVAHVVVCTNEALGLAMALKGMSVQGSVLVPALGFPEIVEATVWAGLDPVFCDVDPNTHQLSLQGLETALQHGVGAAVILEMWGNRCDAQTLVDTASEAGVKTILYAPDGLGTTRNGQRVTCPKRPTVFSFRSDRLLSAGEGGCLATDNGDLAAALRNIRSSYGAGPPVSVPVTANGRFSELQAGLALWSLEHLDASIKHNEAICACYQDALDGVAGLTVYKVTPEVRTNHQSFILLVDRERFSLSRDDLLKLLLAENVDARRATGPSLPSRPAFQRWTDGATSYPVAERLAQELLQLPVGAGVTPDNATRIGRIVAAAGKAFR